jgi:hypothetical protein
MTRPSAPAPPKQPARAAGHDACSRERVSDIPHVFRFVSFAVACAAIGCDDCKRGCDEVYQECIETNSREDCGDERDRCEDACRAEDAIWDGEGAEGQ